MPPAAIGLEGHHDFGVLERRLIEAIRQARSAAAGPLPALAVVAPSRPLLRHLREVLAAAFPGLANVHLYHHMSLARAAARAAGADLPRLLPDGVRDAVVARAVEEAGGELAAYLRSRPGAAAGLRRTMDDLREAGIPPGAAGEPGLSPRGRETLAIHAAYAGLLGGLMSRGLSDRAGMIGRAAAHAGDFARRFDLVVHYGAYDLIGANLDLVEAMAAAGAPVLILAPSHPTAPAFDLARRFWPELLGAEPSFLEGAAAPDRTLGDRVTWLFDERSAAVPLPDLPSGGSAPAEGQSRGAPRVSLFHAQGAAAELREVALRILALHREQGVPPEEIAIVARTLEPYAPLLGPVLAAHRLPFTTSASLPALREARVQAALNLARAVFGDYERRPLLELFRSGLVRDAGTDRQVAAWDRLTRDWGSARGLETWTRDLPAALDAWEPVLPSDADAAARERARHVAETRRRQARALADAVRRLDRLAAAARRATGWAAWAGALALLLAEALDGFRPEETGEDRGAAAVRQALQGIADLDAVGTVFSPEAAPRQFERLLAEAQVPIGSVGADGRPAGTDGGGVRVLDAMQARGLSCRALYLVGWNADLVPRRPREDPFLPDADRLQLRRRFRRPLPIAAWGREEERLLLALLLDATRGSLTIGWQRSDEAGRARVPSLALREVARLVFGRADLGLAEAAARRIPGDPGEAARDAATQIGLLPPGEAVLGAALALRSPLALAAALPGLPRHTDDTVGLLSGLEMLATIEDQGTAGRRGATDHLRFDAFVGTAWRAPARFSPSRLETLGACPQHFFFRYGLQVQELDEPPEGYEVGAQEIGLLVHRVLRDLYEAIAPGGVFESGGPRLRAALRRAWDAHLAGVEARMRPRYPLLWETLSSLWIESLHEFAAGDLAALAERGARLVGAEKEVETDLRLGPAGRVLALHGRLDRVIRDRSGGLVVSDYKTSGDLADQVSASQALKGSRLQIPLYMMMAAAAEGATGVSGEALGVGPAFMGRDPEETRPRFEAETLAKHREAILETLGVLIELQDRGRFPLNAESRLCGRCAYRRACRRNHTATLARLEQAPAGDYYRVLAKSSRKPLLADVGAPGEEP